MLKRGKKGVEPIIATILVIGFVIIIAVAVFTWGDQLAKLKIGESEEEAEAALKCLQTSFNVKSSCIFGPSVQLFLENTGRQDITSFKYAITGETRKAEDIKTSLPVYAAATIPFGVPEELGTAGSIDIYPQVTIKDKPYTCKQPTKNELKDCFTLLNLQNAEEFNVLSGAAEIKIVPSANYKEFVKDPANSAFSAFELQTTLALPKNLLAMATESSATITSETFQIPNDPRIEYIGLYAENYAIKSNYILVDETNNNEITIASVDATTLVNGRPSKVSFEYRKNIGDQGVSAASLLGHNVHLKVDLSGGIGYSVLLRFCYTDKTGICLAK
ncbi:MAG: hypothetical protein PHD81_04865 [Candidatus Nanoarchaeia archaeon]|nr:hypothetical protein [Candidatus Nanoarchaeia archaeon]MDD5588409.1 hypothetical protein [Candidatus Nanoarchaeia archaeon]